MEKIEGLGKRLKDLRERDEKTVEMVAYDISHRFNINLSKGHISKWENEVNAPSLAMARLLCLYYDVSLDYLIGLTDSKLPSRLINRKETKGGDNNGNIRRFPTKTETDSSHT